jgi:SAM-dependent methyltransferase
VIISNKRTKCRSCDAPDLQVVIDFGLQPLAGFYSPNAEDALDHKRYPLVLEICPICDLLQITDLPPITEVFHEDYTYSSSQIPPLVAHFEEYANWIGDRAPKTASVLEFGCNDGVLLNQLQRLGFERLTGVDASPNMVRVAKAKGFDVFQGFFGTSLVEKINIRSPFDLITCSNVFAHIDDIQDTLSAVHSLLKPHGEICIEVHDAEKLILEGQFETIYHEHLTYFSTASLRACLETNGFEVLEIETTPMHGGGLRGRARKAERRSQVSRQTAIRSVDASRMGASLSAKVTACRETIRLLRAEHGLLDGYGVAGRAQMFLAMTGTEGNFGLLFDDAPIRQGRYVVGTNKRIAPFEPDRTANACVILAWNYADAIFERIKEHYESVYVLFPNFTKLK